MPSTELRSIMPPVAPADRLADEPVAECDDLAVRVETGFELMDEGRTITAAAHVVLARPLHFDRRLPADGLGDGDRFDDDIGIRDRAAAEAAAGFHHMEDDFIRRDLSDLRCRPPI